jgi:hypothetical protein
MPRPIARWLAHPRHAPRVKSCSWLPVGSQPRAAFKPVVGWLVGRPARLPPALLPATSAVCLVVRHRQSASCTTRPKEHDRDSENPRGPPFRCTHVPVRSAPGPVAALASYALTPPSSSRARGCTAPAQAQQHGDRQAQRPRCRPRIASRTPGTRREHAPQQPPRSALPCPVLHLHA